MGRIDIERREDWPRRLEKYLEAAEKRPFSWGNNNCCTFVAGAVGAMAGENIMAGFPREKVRDAATARKALRGFAGGGVLRLANKIARRYGLEPVDPLRAGRGDIVYFADEKLLGVVGLSGETCAVVSKDGPLVRPLADADRAWRV